MWQFQESQDWCQAGYREPGWEVKPHIGRGQCAQGLKPGSSAWEVMLCISMTFTAQRKVPSNKHWVDGIKGLCDFVFVSVFTPHSVSTEDLGLVVFWKYTLTWIIMQHLQTVQQNKCIQDSSIHCETVVCVEAPQGVSGELFAGCTVVVCADLQYLMSAGWQK